MLCCIGIVSIGCSNSKQSEKMSDNTENQILTLMVGSYSDSTETALRTYAFDAEDGSSEFICPVPVANASYFIQAPSGLIYVVGEGDEAGSMITAVRPLSLIHI